MWFDDRLAWIAWLLLAPACGSSTQSTAHSRGDAGVEGSEPHAMAGDAATPGGADGASSGGSDGGSHLGAGGASGQRGDAGSAAGGESSEPSPAPRLAPLPLELDGEPEHFRYVRLTHQQWQNSVRDTLRLGDDMKRVDSLAADASSAYAYTNNEELLFVGPELVVDYAQAAESLAREVATDPARLAAVHPGSEALAFIRDVGRRFYRRPLTDGEVARFEAVFETGSGLASAGDAFSGGAGLVLEVILQSPHFLYRIETAAPGQRLNGYELATKLSYFITNTTPSEALLDQAAAQALDSDQGLQASAEQLLASQQAQVALTRFHSETYNFGRYANISKQQDIVPEYDQDMSAELEEASKLFFDHLFQEGLGVRDIFTSRVGFASDEMAMLYEVEGPGGAGLVRVELGAERPGFFTQLPFLILHSVNLEPHPIARGGSLNADVLCANVPPDPVSIPAPAPPPISPDETKREWVSQATAAPGCEICHHGYLNPLGFAFENFDGLGRVRELDRGRPVDTSGSYPFVEGQLEFAGAPELMQLLAESHQAHRCYAAHLAEYGLTHALGPDETELVDALTARSLDEFASLSELILEVVTSPAFHTRRGEP